MAEMQDHEDLGCLRAKGYAVDQLEALSDATTWIADSTPGSEVSHWYPFDEKVQPRRLGVMIAGHTYLVPR